MTARRGTSQFGQELLAISFGLEKLTPTAITLPIIPPRTITDKILPVRSEVNFSAMDGWEIAVSSIIPGLTMLESSALWLMDEELESSGFAEAGCPLAANASANPGISGRGIPPG